MVIIGKFFTIHLCKYCIYTVNSIFLSRRVLIDDRAELGIKWKEMGGIFIHHTDTESTLTKLRDASIIPSTEYDNPKASTESKGNDMK